MSKKLKMAIVAYIFENDKDFQMVNNTVKEFRAYIYDDKGEYLIGGEDVSNFIENAINLLVKN